VVALAAHADVLAPAAAPVALPPIPYQRPEPPKLADAARYYALAEDAGMYSNGGPCSVLLSERCVGRIGGGVEAVPVANCTLGLMVALRAVFGEPVGERRFVIVPAFTFAASAGAIVWAGFEPLFVDVEADSWQLDPTELRRVLTEQRGRVAGVLGCSTFGTPARATTRRAWRAVCDEAGVGLVIDSAAGFGATDDLGRPTGSDGETHVFSFHVTKPFAVGEGGLVTTGDPDVAARIRQLINFGFDATRTAAVAGLNAKMSELHAAMGLAMLDGYDDALARRRARVGGLHERLTDLPVRYQRGWQGSTWQVFQVLAPTPLARNRVLEVAADAGVEARACFEPPLHRHAAFVDCPIGGDLRVSEHVAARALSLPMHNALTPDELDHLAWVVRHGIA
jgi:dTDP-4-amino-4,6-dideoxygalactose transaminase